MKATVLPTVPQRMPSDYLCLFCAFIESLTLIAGVVVRSKVNAVLQSVLPQARRD